MFNIASLLRKSIVAVMIVIFVMIFGKKNSPGQYMVIETGRDQYNVSKYFNVNARIADGRYCHFGDTTPYEVQLPYVRKLIASLDGIAGVNLVIINRSFVEIWISESSSWTAIEPAVIEVLKQHLGWSGNVTIGHTEWVMPAPERQPYQTLRGVCSMETGRYDTTTPLRLSRC